MRTLEQIKKDKNWLACRKGYPMDPEGFNIDFLTNRLIEEVREYQSALTIYKMWGIEDDNNADKVISELADISNFVDYIANKIITKYPDKYKRQLQGKK
jgi:NTP pyrophosphatase (non-canonical NTP hydrolase)